MVDAVPHVLTTAAVAVLPPARQGDVSTSKYETKEMIGTLKGFVTSSWKKRCAFFIPAIAAPCKQSHAEHMDPDSMIVMENTV